MHAAGTGRQDFAEVKSRARRGPAPVDINKENLAGAFAEKELAEYGHTNWKLLSAALCQPPGICIGRGKLTLNA